MLYEVAVHNLRGAKGPRFGQTIVEVEEKIPEPKELSIIKKLTVRFRIYDGVIKRLLYGKVHELYETNEECGEYFKYSDIIREVKQHTARTERPGQFFINPEAEEVWILSKEYGLSEVKVLEATNEYYIVKVLVPKYSRLQKDAQFYIFANDVQHFYKKIK